MTARQVLENTLIELNKSQAPTLLLEDFNYFFNKTIGQTINKIYNLYDINQQKSDDLRVLKSTAVLTPSINSSSNALFENIYEVNLPDDYIHILNCVVEYTVNKKSKCFTAGDTLHFGAKRMTADMFPQLINNYYMRPSYKNPYFYINNTTTNTNFPTTDSNESVTGIFTTFDLEETGDIVANDTITVNGVVFTFKTTPTSVLDVKIASGTESNLGNLYNKLVSMTDSRLTQLNYILNSINELIIKGKKGTYTVTKSSSGTTLTTFDTTYSDRDKEANIRYGNRTKVKMEIRYGKDGTVFSPTKLYVDYLKSPEYIKLTQEQIDTVEDTSQLLEYPDYICQEIVNDLVKLLMENASDPRLQTNIPVNQSIASPGQQQTR